LVFSRVCGFNNLLGLDVPRHEGVEMTFGINVTSKDKEYSGWTALVSGHKLTTAIYDADQEAKRLWDFYTLNVDSWIEQRNTAIDRYNQAKTAEAKRAADYDYHAADNQIYYWQEKAELATMHAQNLRKQRYCPHRVIRLTPEEVWCEDCGAELIFHDTGTVDIIDEWPL